MGFCRAFMQQTSPAPIRNTYPPAGRCLRDYHGRSAWAVAGILHSGGWQALCRRPVLPIRFELSAGESKAESMSCDGMGRDGIEWDEMG